MYTPFAFMRFVAKSALNAVGVGMVGEFFVEVLPDLARDVWERWSADRNPEQMRQEIQQIAQASPQEIHEEARAIVADVAGDKPPEVQQQLSIYLEQIPGAIRQSLRRPADPTGTTLPATMVFRKADDLLGFLPTRAPYFKPGVRPPGIGDWELVELLGMGGFGEVWKARNPHVPNATPVALKFCLDPTAAQLLRHEAGILDRVMSHGRHPGIVELRHTYLGAEPPCLEYEYVAGGDLGAIIMAWHRTATVPTQGKRNPIINQATGLIQDLIEIVAFAHGLTPPIVHRDLKPANILVEKGANGKIVLRVADFGIGAVAARHTIAATSRGGTRGQFLATALRGSHTPLYASPQQSRGDPADPRDDVHALGVMWYQMLTGDLTTGRPGGTRWTKKLAEQGMSEDLLELLVSCIEDDPDDRPACAMAMLEVLRKLQKTVDRGPWTVDREEKPVEASAKPIAAHPAPGSFTDHGPRTTVHGAATETVVVSRLGRGRYTSLAEAVRQAPAGTRILVQPGMYTEGFTLDRPLEIVGDGQRADIVVQSVDGPCILMQTDYALVRNLTLRGRAGASGRQHYTVEIGRGQLVLEECDITSDSLACVGVHGSRSDPIVRRCKIHDSRSAGIFFYEKSGGAVEECEVCGNTHAGIAISQGSNPTIRRCQFHHGRQVGIHAYDDGLGTIEECTTFGHVLNGLEIKQRGSPTVRGCTFQDGVLVWDHGLGLIEECELSGNTAPELAISTQANPTIRRCKICKSKHGGVLIYEGGMGTLEDCDINDNALNGVEIKDRANPILRHCRVRRNKYRGVYVHSSGSATIEFSDLTENTQGAWYITPGCQVQRTGNRE